MEAIFVILFFMLIMVFVQGCTLFPFWVYRISRLESIEWFEYCEGYLGMEYYDLEDEWGCLKELSDSEGEESADDIFDSDDICDLDGFEASLDELVHCSSGLNCSAQVECTFG